MASWMKFPDTGIHLVHAVMNANQMLPNLRSRTSAWIHIVTRRPTSDHK